MNLANFKSRREKAENMIQIVGFSKHKVLSVHLGHVEGSEICFYNI